MEITKLADYGFAPELINAWVASQIKETLPVQDAAVEAGISRGESLLITAPTSSGKTFLGEMVAANYAIRGKKSLFLVPFKAIAEERFSDFTERYGANSELGLKCIISDKDHRGYDADLLVGKYDVGILTYEKLSALLVSNRAMLDVCSCVIVDEIQMISDVGGGPGLELLLTKLKIIGNCQLIGLSAVLGPLNGFDAWLGVKPVRHHQRPVELRTGIVESTGEFNFTGWNTRSKSSEQLSSGGIPAIAKQLVARGEQMLIVRNSVRRVEEDAAIYSGLLSLPAASNALMQLQDEPDTETKEKLVKVLRQGVGFHHGECELAERLAVEAGFRRGEIPLLVSTTTLSMGVNLPCDNVFLADQGKWEQIRGSWQETPWTLAEVNNILGRAGRFGKTSKFGRGMLMAYDRNISRQLKYRYVEGVLDPVKSALSGTDIDRRVLDVLATGFAHTQAKLEEFLFSTFAGQSWTSDDSKSQIARYIAEAIKKCARYELADVQVDGDIKVTELGKVCAAKQCSLDSFQKLKDFVVNMSVFDYLDVAFAAASTSEVKESVRRIKWEDSQRSLSVRNRLNLLFAENKLVGLIQQVFSVMVQTKASKADPEFTIASICRDLLETNLLAKDICSSYRVTGAQVRQMSDNVAWMADAMSGIAKIVRPDLAFRFEEVVKCIQLRSPYSCRFLNDLPPIVSRDERIRLYERGIESTEEFITKLPNDFRGIMSPSKADQITKNLLNSRTRNHEFWERDHKRRLDILGYRVDEIVGLYTFKGIELEHAVKAIFDAGFADCSAGTHQ
jgi:replicative superfamily II helicase